MLSRQMGHTPCQVLRYAAVIALFSFVVLLYFSLNSPDNHGSFLPVCRHLGHCVVSSTSMIQMETIQRTNIDEETYVNWQARQRKHNRELEGVRKEHHDSFNATELVLSELRRGFFAAVNEKHDRDSSPDPSLSIVCVSEPTLLECEGPGFGALLLATLDHVSYCHLLGIYNITFQWKNCETSCIKDPGQNSWLSYFEPLNTDFYLSATKVLCLGGLIGGRVLAHETARAVKRLNPQQIKQFDWALRTSSLLEYGFRKRQSLPGYEEGAIITPQLRKWVHGMITRYIRPQKSLQLRVEQFYIANMQGFNLLGVHIRGTDHGEETEKKTLPALKQWIQDAQAVFDTLEHPKRIFVASDNDEGVKSFVEHFGEDKVVFTAAKRAKNYHSDNPVHSQVTNNGIEIGTQVLIDILLLAKCGYFLHAESSVASLAAFFNPEMKLFFLGYLRDNTMDIDVNVKPLPELSDEVAEAEWEERWIKESKTLAQCYKKNSPYSACPNMARGKLINSEDVREFVFQ